MATGDRGAVAFDDDIELKTNVKEEKKQSKEEEKVETDENRKSSTTKEDRMGSSANKDENRRKSSDFWLLWPQPCTRASMARFALPPIVMSI